jgi:hypothetical protein
VPISRDEGVLSRAIADWGLKRFPNSTEVPDPERVDYIAITKSNEASRQRRISYGILLVGNGASDLRGIANGELIYDGDYYSVYRNLDPETISVARIQ